MNSFNHYAYGAVAGWMFETMAGIGAAEPGFKKLLIHPRPDTRLAVKASYDSAYGLICAESAFDGDTWYYTCSIPANTTAEIRIPAEVISVNEKMYDGYTIPNDGISYIEAKDGEYIFKAAAGTFRFVCELR